MDQIKIGSFIAARRKAAGLTQMQLAEKLNITDRAVSKWETGKSMPDSSIMLELCGILDISANELLCGEVIAMENYNKEMENNLVEMLHQKEESDRNLLTLEWVIGILSVIVLIGPIFIASYIEMEEWQRTVIALSGVLPAIVGLGVAMKIEQSAGYYECRKCGHRYVPTMRAVTLAMHFGRTRYMRCSECGKHSWQRKVIKKK